MGTDSTQPAGSSTPSDTPVPSSRVAAHVKSQPASSAGIVATVLVLIAGQLGLNLTTDEAVIIVGLVTKVVDLLAARLK